MKKFLVYLLVIVLVVSAGFAVFYLVRDNEVISISNASLYQDVGDTFTVDVKHKNKKKSTTIDIASSDNSIVTYNKKANNFTAKTGGIARLNFRTSNAKFRNLWCDVIVGDGSLENPFYISTAEQLAAIGMGEETEVEGVYAGAEGYELYKSNLNYKLVANIDASVVNNGYWIPLKNFNGRIDGNGLTIANINIDKVAYDNSMNSVAGYVSSFPTENVGFVESLGAQGAIYNIKFENYYASGEYTNFGTIAAINNGHIERIEVKDATINVRTEVFGGLVAQNISTGANETIKIDNNEQSLENAEEDYTTVTQYVKYIARIDRCSINLNLGSIVDIVDGNEVIKYTYNSNLIGGIVGINQGGNVVYSYVKGDVYLGKDSNTGNDFSVTYGGLIAVNKYTQLNSQYQGGNIKDCYSNIIAHIKNNIGTDGVLIAGAIGQNIDYSIRDYEDQSNTPIVHNYILGVYYNKDNLNIIEEGGVAVKDYNGIGKFTYSSASLDKTVEFDENATKYIVYGLTTEQMKDSTNFISHTTKDIEFDEEGSSQGIVEEPVVWLFDTVWAIDNKKNDGMPYLNYQLVYIPDDFKTAGIPVMENQETYKFIVDLEYSISILSAAEGKLYITVNEQYSLKLNPYNAEVVWESSDPDIVSVDPETGVVTGKKKGSATVTATTKSGNSSAFVNIIVEEISYTISGYPTKIIVNKGETVNINALVVTPYTDLTATMATKESGTGNNVYADVNVSSPEIATNDRYATYSLSITGKAEGKDYLYLTAKRTRIVVAVEVVDNSQVETTKALLITTNPSKVEGVYGVMKSTGSVSIASVKLNDGTAFTANAVYTFKTSNSSVVEIINENSNTGTFDYSIKGVGNAQVTISAFYKDTKTNTVYQGVKYVNFAITQNTGSGTGVQEKISLNYSKAYLLEGNGVQLKASTNTGNGVAFYSQNTNIATVTDKGYVTGVSGNYNGANTTRVVAYTKAKDGSYIYAYCQVTVIERETEEVTPSITLSKTSVMITSNNTITLEAKSNVSGYITWTTNAPAGSNPVQYDITATQPGTTSKLEIKIGKDFSGTIRITAKFSKTNKGEIVASDVCLITVTGSTEYSQYIYTIDQLNAVRYHLDKDFYLAADIDLGNKTWTPIGSYSTPFTGTFKALKKSNGYYSISNINTTASYAGLFGYIKGANIENLNVNNSSVVGNYAGAIAGYVHSSTLKNCNGANNTIKGYYSAGGITGANRSASVIDGTLVSNTTVSAALTSSISGERFVGGIAGKSEEGSIYNAKVIDSNIYFAKDVYGYAGGIAGRSTQLLKNLVVEKSAVTGNTDKDSNYAGGIVGYALGSIERAVIRDTNVKGYNVGGIGGALNDSNKVTLKFDDCRDGYRKEDLSSYNYKWVVQEVAVWQTVTIKGEVVGGLFGIINNGAVANSYTRARLEGNSSKSVKGGFAAYISASGMAYAGSTGYAGIVEYCYSASTFHGAGDNYSITSSWVHNYAADKEDRPFGFAFNYVFDNDVDGGATFVHGSGITDNVKSKKSTSDMKKASTYTNKGFDFVKVWKITSGNYPVLRFDA